jgi:molybdate transport system regulatory protein
MKKQAQLQLADALGQPSADKRIDILRRIGQVGSISEAARGAGVSYKAAWQAVDTLGNLAGVALLERLVGGSGGGGARLTPAGHSVLQAAERMDLARQEVLNRLQAEARGVDGLDSLPNLSGLALRTSMRNQWPCTVHALKPKGGAMRVELLLSAHTRLWSRVTRESVELLNLKPGQTLLALCKATAVTIGAALEPAEGCSVLQGTVTRASRARSGGEVALTLAGGLHVVGFTPPGVLLKVGSQAVARVDDAAVVLAVTQ